MVGAVGWDFESSVERAWQVPKPVGGSIGRTRRRRAPRPQREHSRRERRFTLGEGAGRFEAAVSNNAYLHARHAIDAHGDALLQERGWRSRTPFSLHRDRRTARTRGGGCCRARRCSRRQLPLAELPFVGTVDGPHPLEGRYVVERGDHRSSSTNGSATRSRGIGSAAPWTKARHRGPTSSPVRRRRQPPPTPGPVGSCGCGCVR